MDEYLTVEEAATLAGVSGANIRKLCIAEKLRCKRFGPRVWQVERASVEAYASTLQPKGWPRGRPRKPREDA